MVEERKPGVLDVGAFALIALLGLIPPDLLTMTVWGPALLAVGRRALGLAIARWRGQPLPLRGVAVVAGFAAALALLTAQRAWVRHLVWAGAQEAQAACDAAQRCPETLDGWTPDAHRAHLSWRSFGMYRLAYTTKLDGQVYSVGARYNIDDGYGLEGGVGLSVRRYREDEVE